MKYSWYKNYWNSWRTQDEIHPHPFGEGERLVVLTGRAREIPRPLTEKFGPEKIIPITHHMEAFQRLQGLRGDVLVYRRFPGIDQYLPRLHANPNLRTRDVTDEHARWTLWVLRHTTLHAHLADFGPGFYSEMNEPQHRNSDPKHMWEEILFARWCYNYGVF